jgi:hypothetical protein
MNNSFGLLKLKNFLNQKSLAGSWKGISFIFSLYLFIITSFIKKPGGKIKMKNA